MQTCMRPWMNACQHAFMHASMHASTHALMRKCIQPHVSKGTNTSQRVIASQAQMSGLTKSIQVIFEMVMSTRGFPSPDDHVGQSPIGRPFKKRILAALLIRYLHKIWSRSVLEKVLIMKFWISLNCWVSFVIWSSCYTLCWFSFNDSKRLKWFLFMWIKSHLRSLHI